MSTLIQPAVNSTYIYVIDYLSGWNTKQFFRTTLDETYQHTLRLWPRLLPSHRLWTSSVDLFEQSSQLGVPTLSPQGIPNPDSGIRKIRNGMSWYVWQCFLLRVDLVLYVLGCLGRKLILGSSCRAQPRKQGIHKLPWEAEDSGSSGSKLMNT